MSSVRKGDSREPRAPNAQDRDDRGKPITPLDVTEFVHAGSTPDEAARRAQLAAWLCCVPTKRRLRHNLKPTWADLSILALGFGVVAVLKVKGWLLQGLGWPATAGISASALVVIYLAERMRPGEPVTKLDPSAAPSLVAEGFCGQCGYSLRGLRAHDDACVVCPECGCAWSERRITRPWWSSPSHVERVAPKIRALRLNVDTRAPVIADHFGRLVPQLVFGQILALRDQSSRDPDAPWNPIERELRRIGRTARIATASVSVALFGAAAYWLSTIQALDFPAKMILMAIATLLGVGIAIVVPRSDMYISRADIVRSLLNHQRCPSCANRLTRVVDDEHVVACTHCGSTWLLPAKNEAAM